MPGKLRKDSFHTAVGPRARIGAQLCASNMFTLVTLMPAKALVFFADSLFLVEVCRYQAVLFYDFIPDKFLQNVIEKLLLDFLLAASKMNQTRVTGVFRSPSSGSSIFVDESIIVCH